MRFVCFGYYDHAIMSALSESELAAVMAKCGPHMDELNRTGRVVFDVGVEPEVRSIGRVNGQVERRDTPTVANDMKIGSVFVLEADDLDHAAELAKVHPTTRVAEGEQLGWRVDVHPVHAFD